MKYLVLFSLLVLLAAGCGGGSDKVGCEKDGDCGQNFKCDIYTKTCRCISDAACLAAGEKCMPDGTCQLYTGCKSDMECGACKRCDSASGECLCTDSCGCPSGEICNASGYCQPSSGCFDNQDCPSGQYCDTGSKSCKNSGTCTTKFQCPLGQICTGGACVAGCEDYGDCPMRASCVNGQCVAGVCQDDSFCGFLEYCNNGTCTNAFSAATPYCKACKGIDMCGSRDNPCLLYPYVGDAFDNAYPYSTTDDTQYCGVDCSGGQRCPNGFSCNTISVVDQNDDCTSSHTCPGGIPCIKDPESDKSYCPCHDTSNPCPANTCLMGDTCGPMTKKCVALAMSGIDVPCTQNSDCNICTVSFKHCMSNNDCKPIVCEKEPGQSYGWCTVGKSCGLLEGFHCQP